MDNICRFRGAIFAASSPPAPQIGTPFDFLLFYFNELILRQKLARHLLIKRRTEPV